MNFIDDSKSISLKVDFYCAIIRDILNDCVIGSHISALILSMCCIDYMDIPLSGNKKNTCAEFKLFLGDYMSHSNNNYKDVSVQDSIWAIRCSLVHTFGDSIKTNNLNIKPRLEYGNNLERQHLRIFNDDNGSKFIISISQFVSEVIAGVEKFFRENTDHDLFIEWYKKLIIISGFSGAINKLSCIKDDIIIYKNIHNVLSILDDKPSINYSDLAKSINNELLRIYNKRGEVLNYLEKTSDNQ